MDPRRMSEFLSSQEPKMVLREEGEAAIGTDRDEVVIALGPAFGTHLTETIVGLPHHEILGNLIHGIEEEGAKARVIKIYDTSDCAFIGHKGARLSGSGIAIGLQSKGTAVIHQKDIPPLDNLELFPQATTLTRESYHMIGKNAGKYAKGETPIPVSKDIDNMARLKYIVKTTLMHREETAQVIPNKAPMELRVEFS